MKITFLGTSAANAFPEAFCKCSNCDRARRLGGPSLRKRSAALVNTDLLLDLGPDIMSAAQIHGCPLTTVRYCLQTHPHADHLDLSHLLSRSPGFGVVGAPVLEFYASPETLARAAATFVRDLSEHALLSPEAERELNARFHPVQPMQRIGVGPYSVLAFPANHAPGMGALLYAIENGGRALLYATDTAAFPEPLWDSLRQVRIRFDLVVLDHTYGPGQTGSDHLSAREVSEHARRMRAEDMLTPRDRVLATHIAHDGNPPHPELVAFAREHGYEAAHDGLVVTF